MLYEVITVLSWNLIIWVTALLYAALLVLFIPGSRNRFLKKFLRLKERDERESQNRVISMALIHEELYKGEGNDTLDFSAYLRRLSEKLFQTYSLTSKNICLCMDMEENVFLNMDRNNFV